MAYTPPSRTAVDYDFLGSYTPPARTAVSHDFVGDLTESAGGFQPTNIGSPQSVRHVSAFPITPQTSFGTPRLIPWAVGFSTTQIAQSHVGLSLHAATGFSTTQHGSHTQAQWAAPWFITQFGTPATYSASTLGVVTVHGSHAGSQYSPATGWAETQYGGHSLTPWAAPWLATRFGSPDTPLPATGFTLDVDNRFGLPEARQYSPATGWLATQFPAPAVLPWAVGWTSTVFGAPSRALYATGWFATPTFGTAFGWSWNLHQFSSVFTRFGTPATATNRTQEASGWLATKIPPPWQYVINPPDQLHRTFVAVPWVATQFGVPEPTGEFFYVPESFLPVQFGSPGVPTDVSLGASGWQATYFGNPGNPLAEGFRSTLFGTPELTSYTVTGWLVTVAGTPAVVELRQASGFAVSPTFGLPFVGSWHTATGSRWSTFGTPLGDRAHLASSVARRPRFGLPRATKTLDYRAYGWWAGARFARPRGAGYIPRAATGFVSGQFGTPLTTRSGKVLHIPPVVRHGTHQMERI